jgi:hypothetical protein
MAKAKPRVFGPDEQEKLFRQLTGLPWIPMAKAEPAVPILAEQVQRFRRLTGLPWMKCKWLLESLVPTERERIIEAVRLRPDGILHDPIEDDPMIRPLFLAAYQDAVREVEEWHAQHIAELEQQSPAEADMARSGRGLCHRIWARTKELLKERHGIEWRSPREMNPCVVFD